MESILWMKLSLMNIPLNLNFIFWHYICTVFCTVIMETQIGLSKDVPEAKQLLLIIRKQIDDFHCVVPYSKTTIDWGSKKRGQGRRCGSMVMGSMSAAPSGLKTYYGVNMSKYKNDWNGDLSWFYGDNSRKSRYYKAREFGLNEIEARLYAVTF